MQYEKTPARALIRRKAMAKHTHDIRKLSTLRVLGRIYKRHENDILTVVVAIEFTLLIIWKA